MKNKQMHHLWIALLSLAGSAVSETADCGDGVELSMRQGDRSNFSIPLNETCSAALITFSDNTDLMLDLRTNSSCPNESLEAQTFTTVIGSDTPEGVATLTFQCSGQVYCMSIDVVAANNSDSQTSIRSVCTNLTDPNRESLGITAGAAPSSVASNGFIHNGTIGTPSTVSSSQSQAPEDYSSTVPALLSGSTGFSTIRGASVLGNDTNAASLSNPGGSQLSSQSYPVVSLRTNSTTAAMVTAFSSQTPYPSISQTVIASLDRTDTITPTITTISPSDGDTTISSTATNFSDDSDVPSIETASQSPEGNQPTGSSLTANPTASAMTAQPFGNGTSMDFSTQAMSQDPSTCACYPLPTLS
jgi:hypothetical protein